MCSCEEQEQSNMCCILMWTMLCVMLCVKLVSVELISLLSLLISQTHPPEPSAHPHSSPQTTEEDCLVG